MYSRIPGTENDSGDPRQARLRIDPLAVIDIKVPRECDSISIVV